VLTSVAGFLPSGKLDPAEIACPWYVLAAGGSYSMLATTRKHFDANRRPFGALRGSGLVKYAHWSRSRTNARIHGRRHINRDLM